MRFQVGKRSEEVHCIGHITWQEPKFNIPKYEAFANPLSLRQECLQSTIEVIT